MSSLIKSQVNYLILILLTLSSCTKIIEVDINSSADLIIVNSFINPDSLFLVNITKSQNILDSASWENNENCTVKILTDDSVICFLQYVNNGFYQNSDFHPMFNKKYTLNVDDGSSETTMATTYVPEVTPVIDCQISDSSFYDEDGNPYYKMEFSFRNNPAITSFYEIYLIAEYINPIDSSLVKTSNIGFYSTDYVLINENILDYNPGAIPFSDELLSEKASITFFFQIKNHYNINGKMVTPGIDTLIFQFRSVSKEYYFYKKRLYKHLFNQENDIWSGTGEPVQMYSNIKNGYGIFAGYSEFTDTLNLKAVK